MNKFNRIMFCFISILFCFFAFSLTVEAETFNLARAYPGLMGFCNFDDNWQYTSWADSAGKNYVFYAARAEGAKLPNCPTQANNGKLFKFKGWTKGYRPGDALTSDAVCNRDILPVGTVVEGEENYVPCYEMVPHIRLSTNGGALAEDSTWTFVPDDMTYMATGSSTTDTVKLPQLTFTGYHFQKESNQWRNSATGEIRTVGQYVPLDGSVWVAVVNSTVTRYDVFKTVGLGQIARFSVEGMESCEVTAGTSSYLSTSYTDGDCEVKGLQVTGLEQYADVIVELEDGSTRTYKFSVEDKTGVNQNGSDIFIVDTSQNIVVGENDAMITDGIYTDQCNSFTVSNTNYKSSKVAFATSKKTGQKIYSGAYHVDNNCGASDGNGYIAFCLDPGRRGPGEMSNGEAEYIKTSDINIETDFGKLIAYIVRDKSINYFNNFNGTSCGDLDCGEVNKKRVAAHVAIRVSAIKNGLSTAFDSADLVYATHYYPYAAVAERLAVLDNDGDISEADAEDALVTYTSSSGNGFKWGTTSSGNAYGHTYNDFKKVIADILSNYDGSTGDSVTNAGFSRTIDSNVVTGYGTNGYSIKYKGTITMPTGTTSASLSACNSTNAQAAGVQCIMNKFEYSGKENSEGRRIYNYEVTINVPDANELSVPTGESDEKKLSFVLDYNGSSLVQSAFIANPSSGTDNLQRMLIVTTTTPDVYVYFNVVPNKCDLPALDKNKCKNKDECEANQFNGRLFVAAGCCRYLLDTTEYEYLHKNYCEPTCTSSTLSAACTYTTNGTGKADVYKIREGEKLITPESSTWEPNIGACVAQVSKEYVNDNASDVSKLSSSSDFVFEDDAKNLMNVEAYKNNRYCQVTCKEDWEISMDSFGNFIGENAVAAGTYFQIINNDMFMSGTRTCYTTFINYDRFMDNMVNMSNLLVEKYNDYSEWSHVWTDLDRQSKLEEPARAAYGDGTNGTLKSHNDNNVVCAEYFSECPDNTIGGTLLSAAADNKYDYFYNSTTLETSCKSIDYSTKGDVTVEKCETPAAGDEEGLDYSDSLGYDGENLSNGGENKSTTMCLFTRTYCDDADVEKSGEHETLDTESGKCVYRDYEPRKTVEKEVDKQDPSYYSTSAKMFSAKDGKCPTNYEYSWDDGLADHICMYKGSGSKCADGTEYNSKCYSCSTGYTFNTGSLKCEKTSCPSGSTNINGTCYSACPKIGGVIGIVNSANKKECYVEKLTNSHTKEVKSSPKYKYTELKCKTFGKVYDYSLKTKGNVVELNTKDYKDVYYTTTETDSVTLDDKTYNVQNSISKEDDVGSSYSKTFYYDCTATAAPIELGGKGTSSCNETGTVENGGYNFSVDDEIFCKEGNYVVDGRFCFAGASSADKNVSGTKETYTATDNKNLTAAFNYMMEKAKTEAKNTSSSARNSMSNYHGKIYSHAYDIFDCQHFQLHNNTDDMDSSKANNHVPNAKIMGSSRSYVKILTEFKPTAAYTYGEKEFMTILGNDNILEQFTEKNDNVYGGEGSYANATNQKRLIKLKTAYGEYETYLYRNYIQNSYYNPSLPWAGEESYSFKNYDDDTEVNSIDDVGTSTKKIIMCSVYDEKKGTGTTEGKEGEVIAFSIYDSSPEWHGGRCYEVTVNYKQVHYVKSSISNSSYYKNKGYWYLSGSDLKEHGDNFQDALTKANERGNGTNYDYSKEQGKWSRLGSFNVFPVSMGTAKNLYLYTYTFGQIGSYANGTLGRIMGTTKSIIKDNARSCFYEVYEEVCACCGYQIDNDTFISTWLDRCKNDSNCEYDYSLSNPSLMQSGSGSLSLYSNSVSLGDLKGGKPNLADNWTSNQKFMYNGYSKLTTEKGYELKKLIEKKGETIYSNKPEYAYYLTPDVLREIRYYNDSVGYELNYNNLELYQANAISCSTTECADAITDEYGPVATFQHYGSKFLVGKTKQGININEYAYGAIALNNKEICKVNKDTVKNVTQMIENDRCRWIDYIESGQGYKNPATGEESAAFRLAFK